jgi:glyoxylase-like metal-dependent hydrolase (beta-lactamase superfamily II)
MMKKILIALGCILLLPVLGILALVAIRETPDGPRVEAAPGVVGVEAGGAYAWVVRSSDGAVLVDAGLDATGAAIVEELKRSGLEPGQIRAVLLTHGHPDHYAAAARFDRAAVVIGAADVPMVRGDRTHYSPFGKIIGAVMPLPSPPPALTPVQGGERLQFGDASFTVVATPGHSPGSVMYLYGSVLFTGDSLMRKKDGVAVAPSLFSEDADRNRASLRALESFTFDTVADGHAGLTRGAKEKLARFLALQQ